MYTLPSQIGEAVITKMTEKFRRKADSNSDDVQKVMYYIYPKAESRIAVKYHFKENRVTYSSREFYKDGYTFLIYFLLLLFLF